MRRLLTTTTALLALAAPLLAAAPSGAAPAEVEIQPTALQRGADPAGAHLDGRTIHDGDVHVKLTAARVMLYGKWNNYYIVATGNREWGNVRLLRVSPKGVTKRLASFVDPFNTELDSDGGQVAYSYGSSTSRPTIALYDLAQKDEILARHFGSLPSLLDFDESRVVASFASFKVKTVIWDTAANVTEKVNGKISNFASWGHDLVGFYSKDPFNGGCQVLAKLTNPDKALWTNCDERIQAASPDGRRFAMIPLLSDGIGPADVIVRKLNGAALVHYSIQGWFGRISWETASNLLMESNGAVRAALVRCQLTTCDRASALKATPDL